MPWKYTIKPSAANTHHHLVAENGVVLATTDDRHRAIRACALLNAGKVEDALESLVTCDPEETVLYVTSLVPDFMASAYRSCVWSPWYVSHPEEAQLDPDVIQQHYEAAVDAGAVDPKGEESEIMEHFGSWLEALRYMVHRSATDAPVIFDSYRQEEQEVA